MDWRGYTLTVEAFLPRILSSEIVIRLGDVVCFRLVIRVYNHRFVVAPEPKQHGRKLSQGKVRVKYHWLVPHLRSIRWAALQRAPPMIVIEASE